MRGTAGRPCRAKALTEVEKWNKGYIKPTLLASIMHCLHECAPLLWDKYLLAKGKFVSRATLTIRFLGKSILMMGSLDLLQECHQSIGVLPQDTIMATLPAVAPGGAPSAGRTGRPTFPFIFSWLSTAFGTLIIAL